MDSASSNELRAKLLAMVTFFVTHIRVEVRQRGLNGQGRLKEWNATANELYQIEKEHGTADIFKLADEQFETAIVESVESRLKAIKISLLFVRTKQPMHYQFIILV